MIINKSSSMTPGFKFTKALEIDAFCVLSRVRGNYYQLGPYNNDFLSEERVEELLEAGRKNGITRFVCHSNVPINAEGSCANDLSSFVSGHTSYFLDLAPYIQQLQCPYYVLQPGQEFNVPSITASLDRLSDLYQIPVGVDLMFPTPEGSGLATLNSLECILSSGAHFAVDFGHMNIFMNSMQTLHDRIALRNLCEEAIIHHNCVEIRISDNNGKADQHRKLLTPTWFSELLLRRFDDVAAPIFYEGKYSRKDFTPHSV